MNLNYKEILRIFVAAWDLSGILGTSLLHFLVSNHLSHLSHPGVRQRATQTWKYSLVKLNRSCFGFLIRVLPTPIVIKKADKVSCVVVWDRDDYLSEAEKKLCDKAIYKDVSCNEKILSDLVASSNKIFNSSERKGAISEKEMKYFLYDYKDATNLGKLYFLHKIHKKLFNVPGHPAISNCGAPTEKASKFLDHHLKPVMQSRWSYIKDSGDFLRKITIYL